MTGTRFIAFISLLLGLALALPAFMILVQGLGGPSLIVLAPCLAWLFIAVPAAGIVGAVLIVISLWLAITATRPPQRAPMRDWLRIFAVLFGLLLLIYGLPFLNPNAYVRTHSLPGPVLVWIGAALLSTVCILAVVALVGGFGSRKT